MNAYKFINAEAVTTPVESVNGKSGVVVLDPDDLNDSTTTHKFTSAGEIAKLAGIEDGAEVNRDIASQAEAEAGIINTKDMTPMRTAQAIAAQAISSLNSLTSNSQTFATGTAGTDFAINSATDVHTFNLPIASGTNTGKLSNTDWTTFNNKQAAGNYITSLTTDVVASGPGASVATIQNNVVSNAKLAQMAANSIKGNNTGSPANALDLTATETTAMLNNFVGDSGSGGTKGLVLAPTALDSSKNKFLRASGVWDANTNPDTTPALTTRAVTTWTARTAAAANQWIGMCWSPQLNLFCGISSSGTNRVQTSPDGITWTARSGLAANLWSKITWSPELGIFCAVSFDGANQVATSPDGITWTARTASSSSNWYDVCWAPALGLFCATAIGGTDRVMTSPDGITWTTRTPAAVNQWYSVTWAPELNLFCAVALTGTNRAMTSPDGINWTIQAGIAAESWHGVTWSPELGLFCAVGITGAQRATTSPDGVTWTGRGIASSSWRRVIWSSELNVFLAVSSSGIASTSPTGVTWTSRTTSATNQWYDAAWSKEQGIFAITGITGTNRINTSVYVQQFTGRNLKLTESRALQTSTIGAPEVSATSATQLGYLSTTTSDVQTQINTKQATLSGASLTAVTVATDDKVLIQDTSDSNNLKTVTSQSVADLRVILVTDISSQTPTTDVDVDDELLLNDGGVLRKCTKGNLLQYDINLQTGTTYTLALTDTSKLIELSNASPISLHVPENATIAFPIGTRIDFIQYGDGAVTFVPDGVVVIDSFAGSLVIAGKYAGVTLYKRATDEWVLLGNLA